MKSRKQFFHFVKPGVNSVTSVSEGIGSYKAKVIIVPCILQDGINASVPDFSSKKPGSLAVLTAPGASPANFNGSTKFFRVKTGIGIKVYIGSFWSYDNLASF